MLEQVVGLGNEDVLTPVHRVCSAMPIAARLLHKDTVEVMVLLDRRMPRKSREEW